LKTDLSGLKLWLKQVVDWLLRQIIDQLAFITKTQSDQINSKGRAG